MSNTKSLQKLSGALDSWDTFSPAGVFLIYGSVSKIASVRFGRVTSWKTKCLQLCFFFVASDFLMNKGLVGGFLVSIRYL